MTTEAKRARPVGVRGRRCVAPVFALVAALCATGCYKATFINPGTVRGVEHDEWTSFFLWGLVGTEVVDVRQFCPGEVAMVRTGANVGTGIVTALTLGIYAPRKVYVTCAGNPWPGPGAPPPPTDRQVEIDVTSSGEPVRVVLREGPRSVTGTPVAGQRRHEWRVRLAANDFAAPAQSGRESAAPVDSRSTNGEGQ